MKRNYRGNIEKKKTLLLSEYMYNLLPVITISVNYTGCNLRRSFIIIMVNKKVKSRKERKLIFRNRKCILIAICQIYFRFSSLVEIFNRVFYKK